MSLGRKPASLSPARDSLWCRRRDVGGGGLAGPQAGLPLPRARLADQEGAGLLRRARPDRLHRAALRPLPAAPPRLRTGPPAQAGGTAPAARSPARPRRGAPRPPGGRARRGRRRRPRRLAQQLGRAAGRRARQRQVAPSARRNSRTCARPSSSGTPRRSNSPSVNSSSVLSSGIAPGRRARGPSQPMPSGGPTGAARSTTAPSAPQQHRVGMPGRRPAEPAQARRPAPRRSARPGRPAPWPSPARQADEGVVDPAQHAGGLLQPVEGDPADQRLHLAHRGGGLDVVAHDVADDQHRVAVGLQEGVVPVAADRHPLGRRPVADGELEVVGLHRRGEQAQLQPLGHLLAGRGEPGVVQGERRRGGRRSPPSAARRPCAARARGR